MQLSPSITKVMGIKQQAIAAINSLPDDIEMVDLVRELAFITGIEGAREELRRGEGMKPTEAKAKLREWITG